MALSGLGMGLLVPSSNNAGLDLLPERAGVISGIRGLFRSTGGVIGTAIIVLWLELSPDKAAGMRQIFTMLGFLMLATMPLVFLIPDSARDRLRAIERDEALKAEAELAATREKIAASLVVPSAPALNAQPPYDEAPSPQPPLPPSKNGETKAPSPAQRGLRLGCVTLHLAGIWSA